MKFNTWDETFSALKALFSAEASRHMELISSDKISEYDKKYFDKLLSADITSVELSAALVEICHECSVSTMG